MKKVLAIVIAVIAMLAGARAEAISAGKIAACEAEYRAKGKAERIAAPKGFKPDRPKGYKAQFMAECLSK